MAQTNRQTENVAEIDPVLANAKRMTFRVDNGNVMLGSNGALFAAPAWDTVSEAFKQYAVWKMLEYRLQTATGDVSAAAAKIAGDPAFAPERNCDAYESHYVGVIREKILSRLPAGTKTTTKTKDANGKEVTVQSIVNATAEAFRDAQFRNVIDAAIALGSNKPSKSGDKTPRGKGGAAAMSDLF